MHALVYWQTVVAFELVVPAVSPALFVIEASHLRVAAHDAIETIAHAICLVKGKNTLILLGLAVIPASCDLG